VADAEARTLAREVGGLHYANVKVGHWSVTILTYICEEAFSVVLVEDTAECVDCAVAESLRLVLVLSVLVLGRDELESGRDEVRGTVILKVVTVVVTCYTPIALGGLFRAAREHTGLKDISVALATFQHNDAPRENMYMPRWRGRSR
jgi:hypothetical protein